MKFTTLLIAILITGCAKSSDSSVNNSSPHKTSSAAVDTCEVTRPGGLLENGAAGTTVRLYRKYLSQAYQSIHIVGQFPNNYVINDKYSSPTRTELLQNAAAYQWQIGPAKDEDGQWTKLKVLKEVLYMSNNEAYFLDTKIYNYGDAISFIDTDANIKIDCNIPAN